MFCLLCLGSNMPETKRREEKVERENAGNEKTLPT
jgi:hypothetical protein